MQSSTAEFFKDQLKTPELPTPVWKGPGGYAGGHESRGAVPDLARNRSFFYNMGEVLVDHILYDWEWTGDLAFMATAFDVISDKLLWEERCLDPDGDGLYENWLNTWVSDAHWYNGSGCIQASVYNWRANRLMAGGGKRLLPLVNPANLDDWLCNPYARSGFVQMLGEKTHARILDLDLGEETQIESCELECLSNEVLVGLLGVTLL